MQLLPIDKPTDTGSEIFNGDKWLGLATGIGAFFLTLWYAYKPGTQSLTMLVYWITVPTFLVFLMFFNKLYKKNIRKVSRFSLLMPFVAIIITITLCALFVWPMIISNFDYYAIRSRWDPWLKIHDLVLLPASLMLTWMVVKALIPGKWWKHLYD